MQTVLIIGSNQIGTLESSYARAFQELQWNVNFWNPLQALQKFTPGSKIGQIFSQFVRVEPWIKKTNREFVTEAIKRQPDLIITFTHDILRVGALAQICASTKAQLINIWPDTMVNWETNIAACANLYDLIATYSQATVPIIEKCGAKHVVWIPLAGDPYLHLPEKNLKQTELGADVTFIGGWRPEREQALSQLATFNLKIWGPDWGRYCKKNSIIMRAWQGRALRGAEFSQAVVNTKVNLNIIDPTNYPAANMRYFEIPTAGGLQVSSPTPEMEQEFRHEKEIFYYSKENELPALLQSLLMDNDTRQNVAKAAHTKLHSAHTYTHRVLKILQHCHPELL